MKKKITIEEDDVEFSAEHVSTYTLHAKDLSPEEQRQRDTVSKQWREGVKQHNPEYHRRANGRKIVRTTLIESCSFKGVLLRETPHFYVYAVDAHRRDGDIESFTQTRIQKSNAHIDPCKCCTDHPETFYPEGDLN